jgi:TOMM system kinase/cyclase fusion protein
MTFEEILDQAVAMLQRRGRIAYSALKRQFDLDDAYLEDLKDALLFAHPVVDEDGRGLVWTGETEATPVTLSQPDQPESVVEQAKPARDISPHVELHTSDAERRQLTVMFCDLVDSTALSGQLDPEDLRDVIRAYQAACNDVIQRFEGYVAQHLGDGLLVYFGYPAAHEDDAQRAVRTGLGILDAIRTLNQQLAQSHDIQLAVRMGIHTGLVVIGDIGAGVRHEQLALGEAPNVASRIQGLAEPDTVVISHATYRLIEGYFECDPLGERALRGVADPVSVYRVLGASGVQGRLEIAHTRGLTPLVGRESEVTLLLELWDQVQSGQGQVVLLSGESGIGKSRLVQVLKDHVADESYSRLECRSSPYFTNSALYPIIDMVQRTLRFQVDDTPETKLDKLEQNLSQYRLSTNETVPLFGALLSLPVPEDKYPPLNLSPQRQRQKTFEAIVSMVLELAEQQPVLFILEDLHWTDPTTLEFIDLLIDQTPTTSVCILLTCRPEFQPSWSYRSYLTEMTINRLSHNQVEQMAQQVADGKRLPDEIVQQLVDKTDGVPLYLEEMTRAVLETGTLKEVNGQYELVAGPIASLSIPSTLQDSLMARLDRLVTAKGVAQFASVMGRQFSYELLQAVSELDEATLQRELERLVEAELVYQRGIVPGATYIFKHALIQDIAYESLLRSTRQGYHRRIVEVLVEDFPEMAETQPELLAHHYSRGGNTEKAVEYLQLAGQQASQRSANKEAVSHFTTALELLKSLPDTPERAQQELTLQVGLAVPLSAAGFMSPEVSKVYSRARELCRQVGETPQLFPVLSGLRTFYHVRGELQTSRELGEQSLTLAQSVQDSALLVRAHRMLGDTLFWLGELVSAQAYLEQAIALYDSRQYRSQVFLYGYDPGVFGLSYEALVLWFLGYPDQALKRSHEALTLAQELSHPFSLSSALNFAVWLHQHRREVQLTQEGVETLMTFSTEQGFALWLAWGTAMQGWALAEQGQVEEGIAQIRQCLDTSRAAGAELGQSHYLALMAEAHGKVGQAEEGLSVLTEALTWVDKSGERFYEAELYRLKGVLLLKQAVLDVSQAEACLHQALDVARLQQAKSFELRAATSLARLWQSQGKRDEARELLEPVYSWFTEGFDTADLIDAKTLLDELAEVQP